MCGIAGFVGPTACSDAATAVLRSMTDALRYRGPDDCGLWLDRELQVAFGHRRLSIVDLTAAGHQPMASVSGRYVITYNGEIYNYEAVRAELLRDDPALRFRGHSDTEVMLAAFDRWGVRQAVARLNGMFAFALLDRERGELFLARDRLGEKPLYYCWIRDDLLFGSEIKALKQHPAWRADIDRGSLARYLRYAYVPGTRSIYEGVLKVAPGEMVIIDVSAAQRVGPRRERYWSAQEVVARGVETPLSMSDADAIARLTSLLTDAVGLRMVADVPLGAFLSGGIDSSVVVALMQRLSNKPVRTFSIGFSEKRFNEAESARAVARHLGTEHTELYVTPQESLEVIPRLPAMYDEPFADSSQIPTYLVSQLAREHVTVSLSGDGGDELFCGYDRYEIAQNLAHGLERLPKRFRTAAATAIRALPLGVWDFLGSPLPERITAGRMGDRMYKLAQRFKFDRFPDIYDSVLAIWEDPVAVLAPAEGLAAVGPISLPAAGTRYEQMMAFDLDTYLPDDILVKVDRASMAVSLEARVPLLDHRVVEFAWRLPMQFKRRDGVSKWLLRQVLYGLVPRELVDRPKQGFGVPIEHWLKGELRGWACDLLAEDRIRREGFFDPVVVSRHLDDHLSGRRSWASQLWALLMFQAWLDGARERA
jgi:asparagine synthase (glutamine-hydrolysing)